MNDAAIPTPRGPEEKEDLDFGAVVSPASPLRELDAAALQARDSEILLLLTGTDDTFATIVHARTSYKPDEFEWDRKFNHIFNPPGADGVMSLDISRLDETLPVA